MMTTERLPHPENLTAGERWRVEYSDHTSTAKATGEFREVVLEYGSLWLLLLVDGENVPRSIPWKSLRAMRKVK